MESSAAKDRLFRITNNIVSASASIIAIVALLTAVYQAKLARDQAKAVVWPYLIQGNSGNDGYSRIIQNVGLGPALIRGFEVTVDGHVVHSWKEMAESMHVAVRLDNSKSTTFRAGLVLPMNTLTELLQISDSASIKLLRSRLDHLDTWVCYCSLYGDCWTAKGSELQPQPVKVCRDDPNRRFLQ
jgi:hypothetical protein